MGLIYEDTAEKLLTLKRIVKYQKWVEEAEKARKAGSTHEKKNQYDKAEELVTFYTFAPLEVIPSEVRNNIVQEILGFVDIDESINKVNLHFEKDLPSPDKYLEWLSEEVKNHPIRYIRKQAEIREVLEGYTQVDALLETDNLLILIEVKFTADISYCTKFGLMRNQIARIIDVGLDEAERRNKKLVVLLSTPTRIFRGLNRLYYYKMQEYSETSNIQKDLPWRTNDEINKTLLKLAWIPLEKIIEIIYGHAENHIDNRDTEKARSFFEERMLHENTSPWLQPNVDFIISKF